MVVNEAPLNSILNNPEATGRVALWGIELSPLDIVYEKRQKIKYQVLTDFLVHWMELQLADTPDMTQSWTMHFDGSKREARAGAWVILTSPQGDKMKYVLRMKFRASKNEAEYEALIHDMRMPRSAAQRAWSSTATRTRRLANDKRVRRARSQHDRVPRALQTHSKETLTAMSFSTL